MMPVMAAPLTGVPGAWTCGVALRVHGVRVGVRSDDETLLDTLRASEFPRGWRESDEPEVDHLFGLRSDGLWEGEHLFHTPRGRDAAVRALGNRLHVCIAEHAVPEVFVHAAAVEVHGWAVLMPGRSYSGKSSLALALCRRGGRLLSDDFAVLDASGRVRDYALPLSRRRDGDERDLIPPEDLGWIPGREPLPVGLVLLTSWQEAATFRPRALTGAEAALGLFGQAVAARRDPSRVMAALARAVESARCWEGPRGEAAEAAAWVFQSDTHSQQS